jgi:hypothetical protein
VTPRPHPYQRGYPFAYTVADYEWLARWYGYDVNCLGGDDWKGPGTGLLVLSKHGEPLTREEMREFREVLEDGFTPVGFVVTATSVG